MTNTYSSKKTGMKRGKGSRYSHCKCSYCLAPLFGRNHKRGNKFQWILKFDALPREFWMINHSKITNSKKVNVDDR